MSNCETKISLDDYEVCVKYTQLFIDGKFCNSSNGETFPTECPYTGMTIVNISKASVEDIDRTTQAAQNAFKQWRLVPASVRGKYLLELATLIEQNARQIAVKYQLINLNLFK